jgi:hypothetical protein
MKKNDQGFRADLRFAIAKWGKLPPVAVKGLKEMEIRYGFSLTLGDLLYLDCGWYVTHSALLRLANRAPCSGIHVQPIREFSDASVSRWVFKAIVFKSTRSRGFVGYGDADPSNVSSLVHGAEMRVAETRAVNRALRKAYGIGLCSVEELGWAPRSNASDSSDHRKASANGNNGQPRLRDRLCLLIRQHQLDAGLVKSYAADFCGTPTLRDASRDQVEAFINDLAERADKDRDGLVCQLNSYSKSQEVVS